MICVDTFDDSYFSFLSEAEAEDFAKEYLADEEPGSYSKVTPEGNGRFRLDLFEADGYQINRPAPKRF